MTATEKIYETLKDLPEPLITELLDFAEFLREKKWQGKYPQASGELLVELKGGLESSNALAGEPMEIQERLRNEWN